MIGRTLLAIGFVCTATTGTAQGVEPGQQEYLVACAGCHGESGKGDGPLAGLLEIHTPDLTKLTHRAGGTFPYRNTMLLIDGRNEIRAHGSDMPVWGDRYFSSAAMAGASGLDPVQADFVARGRLTALVDYLSTIQGGE